MVIDFKEFKFLRVEPDLSPVSMSSSPPKLLKSSIRRFATNMTTTRSAKPSNVDVFVQALMSLCPMISEEQLPPALDRSSEKRRPRSCWGIRRLIRLTFTCWMKFRKRLRWRNCWPTAIKVPAPVRDPGLSTQSDEFSYTLFQDVLTNSTALSHGGALPGPHTLHIETKVEFRES